MCTQVFALQISILDSCLFFGNKFNVLLDVSNKQNKTS